MTDKKKSNIEIRYTELSDGPYLKTWLADPTVSCWFPMEGEAELDDAVFRWVGFARYKCSLTALLDGEPCGIATLYLQPYKKLAHQCEFGIVVGDQYRGQGVGSDLLKNMMHLAKSFFKIELIHLQVYAENPAIRLYQRFGFREFGRQNNWIKEGKVKSGNSYVGRVFMERYL